MRITTLVFLISISASQAFSQTPSDSSDTKTRKRIPNLSEEIANLTRTALGEGDLRLELWMQYTVTENRRSRSGRIFFSDKDSAFAWTDDVTRPNSFFFKKSPTSPVLTIIPLSNKGNQLTDQVMEAMGFTNHTTPSIEYTSNKDSEETIILGRDCKASTYSGDNANYIMWSARKSDLQKRDRKLLERGLEFWFRNQASKPFISSAIINSGEFPLGYNFESYEFRILDWGFEGDFVLALDKMMINIPGRSLNQVAKEYSEKLESEKLEEEKLEKEN